MRDRQIQKRRRERVSSGVLEQAIDGKTEVGVVVVGGIENGVVRTERKGGRAACIHRSAV